MEICPVNEWEHFLETLRTNLPTTFRISSCRKTSKRLLEIIQNEFFDKYVAECSTEGCRRPYSLPWYPNGLAWQLDLTRKDIRGSESHYKLHNFLIAETTAGSISRRYRKYIWFIKYLSKNVVTSSINLKNKRSILFNTVQ